MKPVEELRGLTAGRLLEIWRESGGQTEDPLERALLSNAVVLAECCFTQGETVFENAEDVLRELTTKEMEHLLRRLSDGGGQQVNPSFDEERFRALLEG